MPATTARLTPPGKESDCHYGTLNLTGVFMILKAA